ncbi:MAG: cyclic nucleotide-binding domain-containing protein, partial [Gemmatimonadaceae bacterium]|nr:cyclic nucleotide-binding domain-containing protein [Gemmatimonadaceae bacterium]
MSDLPSHAPARPTPAAGIPPRGSTVEFLATVPLFHELGVEELTRFAELVLEKSYPRAGVIVFEDDPGDAFFIVREGRVKVVLVADDGREIILNILGPGEHFGELALIDDRPRSANVVATEDATLLVLRREDFRRR